MPQDDTKNLLFLLSLGGGGNHVTTDFLVSAGAEAVDTSLIEFWPTFVLARSQPTAPSIAKWFVGMDAAAALREFYRRLDGKVPSDPLNEATATDTFARALQRHDTPNLVAWHNYELVSSIRAPTRDGRQSAWNRTLRDEARSLFERSVAHAGFRLRIVALVRHPVNLYLSLEERVSAEYSEAEISTQVRDLFSLVEGYADRADVDFSIVRYEALCRHDPTALTLLLEKAGFHPDPTVVTADRTFHAGEVNKLYAYPRARIVELTERFRHAIGIGGYDVALPGAVAYDIRRVRHMLEKWRHECRNLNRVFKGDMTSSASLYRHRWSRISRLYWQINLLIPWRRRAFARFHRYHYPSQPMPRPILERMALTALHRYGIGKTS